MDAYLSSRAAEEARLREEIERRFDVSALKSRVERQRQAAAAFLPL